MKEEMSLGERIFVFSNAGQREIAKEDWQSIPVEDREEGKIIFNELKRNGGIINLEDKGKRTLIEKSHELARIFAEQKHTNDRMIDPETLKEDLKYMADLLKESSPEKTLPGEKKLEPSIGVDDLKTNFHKLPREGQDSILRQLDDVKARNEKAAREEGFKRLPEDIKAGVVCRKRI